MSSSPPNKLFDGQTGFPTPNAPPEEIGCRVFSIPSDEEWFALFMAAAERLTYEWAWFQNGTMTPSEAAAAWNDIIDQAVETSLTGECSDTVPAPYWDLSSGDDADDTAPVLEQIWYGEIVTSSALIRAEVDELSFKDNLGIWLIAGFIAYAGQPAAAIAFVPIAKRFVLAFQQHSLGGVVRVLVDFLHLADIDTYGVEDKVLNLSVMMPDDEEEHTIYVEMSEDNPHGIDGRGIRVIRKRLSEDEYSNPAYRYDEACACVQYSPDGGMTWIDAPESDPRHATRYALPLPGGGGQPCDAAANMVKWLHDFIDGAEEVFALGGIAVTMVNFLFTFTELIFPPTGLVQLIVDVAGTIFGVGETALTAAFTSTEYDLLLCIFACRIEPSGAVTAGDLALIQGDVSFQLNTTAALVVNALLSLQGEVGLQNAGAIGTETGDCSACECEHCHEWDFTVSDGGWSAFVTGCGARASYSAGIGWVAGCDGYTQLNSSAFPSTLHVTKFWLLWTVNPDLGRSGMRAPDVSASIFQTVGDPNIVTIDGQLWQEWPVGADFASMWIAGDNSGATQQLAKCRINYTGDEAFGGDNC